MMQFKYGSQPSWTEMLRQVREEVLAAQKAAEPTPRRPDPWEIPLAGIHGEIYGDQERLSTEAAFSHLNVKRSKRNSAAARRLARAMRHLGWDRARWRPTGTGQKIRGFVRIYAPTGEAVSPDPQTIERNHNDTGPE
jgi:hypothetical protein